MKNRLCYIFMCLLMCFIFVGNVYAENVTISYEVDNSNENVTKGENRAITIKLTAEKIINSCQFKLESDSNIVFNTVEGPNNWSVSGTQTEGITVTKPGGSTIVPNNIGIAKLTYTINDNGKVTIKEIKCTGEEDSQEYTANDLDVTFTTIDVADDTTLSSLSVEGGNAIDFKSDKLSYGTSIESSTFGLKFEASNPDYQDDIVVKDSNGNVINDPENITFNDPSGQGKMLLKVIVNEKTTYDLLISYVKKELDNSLSFIKINGSELTLSADKSEYVLNVDSDVENVEVLVGLKDSENFQIGKSSNIDGTLLSGNFTIKDAIDINIIVEPRDSSTGATSRTYTIHIKKNSSEIPEEPKEDPKVETPSNGNDQEVTTNPGTGDISMFVMLLVLISSLVGSLILYRKNLEGYK